MKALIVVPPLAGHENPARSVAAALEARGHRVAWARVTSLPDGIVAAIAERSRRVRGMESVEFLWQEFLVPLARAMRPLVERAVVDERPDVILADQQAIAGGLVARRLGIPWATLATTSAGVTAPLAAFPKVAAWVEAQLATLQREAELPVVADAELSPRLVIVLSTRALVGDAAPLPPQARLVGPALGGRGVDPPFPWDALRPRRRVLVSLGTISADRGPAFWRAVAAAFACAPWQAILVAPPALVGPVPDDVIVRERVPQLALLPHVDAVVSHAGHNTVVEALAHGLPLVVAPIRDDQPVIAGQVVAAGCGVRVRHGRLDGATLRAALRRVLDEPAFRAAAARVRASFHAAGGADAAGQLLEALAP